MPEYYRIYGLRIRSNVALPGLFSIEPPPAIDLEVFFGSKPQFASESAREHWYTGTKLAADGTPNLQVWSLGSSGFHLRYGDDTEFYVNSSGSAVWATWPQELTLEDTAIYFEGPVLGFLLRLRGTTCLHASAIAIGDQAIAMVGPAGAGKSTTAATFSSLGYPVISEDVVALSNKGNLFFVEPGYPRIRLWPDPIEKLFGPSDRLPLLTPTWDKRYLDLSNNGSGFRAQPLPLSAVYILGSRSSEPPAPFIKELSPGSGLMELVTNTYTNYMLSSDMRAAEFELLGKIVGSLPVKTVVPHEDPAYLPRLCEVIVEDFARSTRSASSSV